MKKANLLTSAQKSTTENQFVIFDFYRAVQKKIAKIKLFDKPENIWNCGESRLPSDPKKLKLCQCSVKLCTE